MTKPKHLQKKPRKAVRKDTNEYPIRLKALGKSKGSTQGVAGWRSGYYRLDETARDSGDFLQTYLDSLKH